MEKAGKNIMNAIQSYQIVSRISIAYREGIIYVLSVTSDEANLVLGGEAAMWAEYVDATNIIPRLFPFVGAVAERLWSPVNSSTTADAKHRLDEHRCRLLW